MKCLNRKVLIGIALVAASAFFLVPSARGALPLLLVAACPLSMVLMMGGMAKMGSGKNNATDPHPPQDELAAKDAEIARLNDLLRQDTAADRP